MTLRELGIRDAIADSVDKELLRREHTYRHGLIEGWCRIEALKLSTVDHAGLTPVQVNVAIKKQKKVFHIMARLLEDRSGVGNRVDYWMRATEELDPKANGYAHQASAEDEYDEFEDEWEPSAKLLAQWRRQQPIPHTSAQAVPID